MSVEVQDIKLRCSGLPLVDLCPGSAHLESRLSVGSLEMADLGSAGHEFLVARIHDNETSGIAEKWNVDPDELIPLGLLAFKLWKEVEHFFPNPHIERRVSARLSDRVFLGGTADYLSVVGNELRILDLKTGWLEIPCKSQVMGYGRCALEEKFPEKIETVYAAVLRPRKRVVEGWRWTREEIFAWADSLARRVEEGSKNFNLGLHCARCPSFYVCPDGAKWVQGVIKQFEDGEGDFLSDLAPDNIIGVLEKSRALEKIIDRAKDMVKVYVSQAGGSLRGSEKTLNITEQNRREIFFPQAKEVIESAIGATKMEEIISIGKTRLDDAVRENATRGQKGKVVKDLWDRLEEAGAVNSSTIQKLEVSTND